jgi:ADP-ribosyl-[dinitrogen reductase] hydrolase
MPAEFLHPARLPWRAAAAGLPAAGGLADRALGAYLGLAIGDALGATVEFMTRREIAAAFADDDGVHRHIVGGGWLKLKAGQVTDDTTMCLALGEGLLQGASLGRPFDTALVAESFAAWLRAKPVDCGATCRRGIRRYLQEGSLAGPVSEGDAGNGAAMRNLPAVLATLDDEEAFVRVSLAQSHITHHNPVSDAAVLGLGRLTRALLAGADPAAVAAAIDAMVAATPQFRFSPYPGRASAWVVDTVQTVLHCFTAGADFAAAVTLAVNQGDDADTTGALVGMLAGARCGARALPRQWLSSLDPEIVRAIVSQGEALLAMSSASGRRAPAAARTFTDS